MWPPPPANAKNGYKYFLLQLKDCMMENSCWFDGGLMSIGNPTTSTLGGDLKQ